jgi:hypothetical protein
MSDWRAKSRPSARFMLALRAGARQRTRASEAHAEGGSAFERGGGWPGATHPKAMGEQKQERQHSCQSRLLPLPARRGASAHGCAARGAHVQGPRQKTRTAAARARAARPRTDALEDAAPPVAHGSGAGAREAVVLVSPASGRNGRSLPAEGRGGPARRRRGSRGAQLLIAKRLVARRGRHTGSGQGTRCERAPLFCDARASVAWHPRTRLLCKPCAARARRRCRARAQRVAAVDPSAWRHRSLRTQRTLRRWCIWRSRCALRC